MSANNYSKKKIGDLCFVSDCLHITPQYEEQGYSMVRVSEIGNNTLDLKGALKVSKENYMLYTSNYVPQKGDIILARVGAFLGQFSYVDTDEKFCIGQNTTIIHPYNFSKYIFYNLISETTQKRLHKEAAGSAYKSIGVDAIKKFEINIPTEEFAIRIGEILYSIDTQIKRNNDMVHKLQVLALNSFDYFSKGIDGSNSVVLRDILIERDKSPIQVNNIVDASGDIPFFTSGETILYTNEKLITGFNIFLSTGGTAKVQAYYGDVSYSTDTWCVTSKNNLQYYLYGYFKHIESQMDKLYFHGTGLKHLQKPIFLKSVINIPDEISLKKYNSIVEPIYIQISKIEQSIIKLQKLKNKLLPLLINQQLM